MDDIKILEDFLRYCDDLEDTSVPDGGGHYDGMQSSQLNQQIDIARDALERLKAKVQI